MTITETSAQLDRLAGALPLLDPAVVLTVRVALAALFIAAAYHKLTDLGRFRATLAAYRLLPPALVGGAAVATVLAEAVAAFALLCDPLHVVGAATAAALLTVYAVAIGINLLRGRYDLDCGCGGPRSERPISIALVARNVALIFASMCAAAPTVARPLHWLDGISVVGTLSCAALVWAAADGLASAGARHRLRAGARP